MYRTLEIFFVLSLLKILFPIFQKNSTFNRKKSLWKVKCTVRLIESTEYVSVSKKLGILEFSRIFFSFWPWSLWKPPEAKVYLSLINLNEVSNICLHMKHLPYPCSHFYIDIKFGDRLCSKDKRRAWPIWYQHKSDYTWIG